MCKHEGSATRKVEQGPPIWVARVKNKDVWDHARFTCLCWEWFQQRSLAAQEMSKLSIRFPVLFVSVAILLYWTDTFNDTITFKPSGSRITQPY